MSHPQFPPARGRYFPAGIKRINWSNPMTAGLSLVKDCGYISPAGADLCLRGAAPLISAGGSGNSVRLGFAAGGVGVTGAGGITTSTTSNLTYTVNTTQGSCFAFVTASFAPGDGAAHAVLDIRNVADTQLFSFVKFTDNNWYFGWFNNPTDSRTKVLDTGTWAAGRSFVAGGTWDTTDTLFYTDGIKRTNKGSAPSTYSTSGSGLSISGDIASGAFEHQWATNSYKDAVHWVAFWDRVLSTAEIRRLNDDPACLFLTEDDLLEQMLVGTAPSFLPAWAVNANKFIGSGLYAP